MKKASQTARQILIMTIFEEIKLALQQAIEYEKTHKNVQICVKITQDSESGGMSSKGYQYTDTKSGEA